MRSAKQGILSSINFLLKNMYANCSHAVKVLLLAIDENSEGSNKKKKI